MISRRFGTRSVLSALTLVLAAMVATPAQADTHKGKPASGEAAASHKAHGKRASKAKKKGKDKDKDKDKAKAKDHGKAHPSVASGGKGAKPEARKAHDADDQAAEELNADTGAARTEEEEETTAASDKPAKGDKADAADKGKADAALAKSDKDESDDDQGEAAHAKKPTDAPAKHVHNSAPTHSNAKSAKGKTHGKTASLGAGNKGKAPKKTASREKTTKKAPKKGEANAPIKPCLSTPIDLDRNGREPQRLTLVDCHGSPREDARRALSVLSRPWGVARPASSDGALGPGIAMLDSGLLTRVDALARRYPGRRISIISGYRPTSQGSLHQSGRALNLRVAGAENIDVVGNCRRLADSGCGYYPNSSFVHVDVRPIGSGVVHWIDASAPGEPPRYVTAWPPAPGSETPAVSAAPNPAPSVAPVPANTPAPRSARKPPALPPAGASAPDGDDEIEAPPASTDPPPSDAAPAPEDGAGGEGGAGAAPPRAPADSGSAADGLLPSPGRAPRRAGPPSLLPALDTAPRR